MNEYLEDIVNRIAEQITDLKDGGRSPKKQAYANFLHGVEHLIIQLWRGTQIHEGFEGGINKRAGWYSGKVGEGYGNGYSLNATYNLSGVIGLLD